jgi:flagellar protein FlgJ
MADGLRSESLGRWAAREATLGQWEAQARAAGGSRADGEPLRQAAQELEAVFLAQVISEMRRTVSHSGLMDGGVGEEIFQEQWDYEVARRVTQTRGLGLAEAIYQQLSRRPPSAAARGDSNERTMPGGEDDADQ